MKSAVLALLPLASLAIAESACSRQTVTLTEYEKVYETVSAVKADAETTSSICSRRTVTTTTHEKVYVTVTAEAVKEDAKSTSTSTDYTTTTVTVRPSSKPAQSSNVPAASAESPYPALTSTPVQSVYSNVSAVPQSETSKSSEAVKASPTYEAPGETSHSSSSSPPEAEAANVSVSTASKRGDATFYGGNVSGGMCSFTGYTIPSGIFGTALSDSNWEGAQACGSCVSVTGPSGDKITAMVVDQCPGCGPNHLDLFPDAFAKLAEPSKGVISVSWEVVPCGITTPIVLKNKSGTSKYWFSMQVMNANVPVQTLEVSTDGGSTWKSTTRKDYNFFENPAGFGTDTVDVRVTSVGGKQVIVKSVSIAPDSTKTAGGNFSS